MVCLETEHMPRPTEPAVKLEPFAAVLGISVDTFYRRLAAGQIPPADINPRVRGSAWHLSTLRLWRPDVARRCQAVLKTLKDTPLTAA